MKRIIGGVMMCALLAALITAALVANLRAALLAIGTGFFIGAWIYVATRLIDD